MAATPPRLRVDLLGTPRLSAGERVTTRFETRRTALLLARLALPPLREWSRDELIELLWPDEDPVLTRTRLRQTLASLRRALEEVGTADEEVVLRASRASVALDVEQVASDVVELEACLRQASATPEQRREALDRALKLYENHLMPGFYETWVLSERERLENRLRTALLQLAQSLRETEPDAAITYARTAVNLEPLDETAQESLLKLLVQTGRTTEALRHWKDIERLFWKELRTTPPPTLKAVLELVGGVTTTAPMPETVVVYPVASAPEPLLPRTLPASLDAFFGREQERVQLTDLLAETSMTRLVTLTGPPGVGKTRLALEVAQQLSRRNIVFVALESFPNGAAALEAIYDAAGGRHEGGPLLPALTRLLDAYETPLLVLDNAEGVQGIAEALQQLLQSVPELRCLVTSRQALRLPGEREMILEPLVNDTALQLLLDRARQTRPDLSLTPQNEGDFQGLCQDLDGLPLALELASGWLKLLSPDQVRARLKQAPQLLARRASEGSGRHDSLHAALNESVQRLSDSQRAIFLRLAVFRGGWSLESAERLCEDLTPLALLDLEALRDASLVSAQIQPDGRQRFRYLETVREYATRIQSAEERASAQHSHLRHFCDYTEALAALFESPRQHEYAAGIAREWENLQAGLDYGIQAAPVLGTQLALGLWRYWERSGRHEQALGIAEQLIASLPQEETWLHARLQELTGRLLGVQFQYARAIPYYERAQALFRQAEDLLQEALLQCAEAAARRDAHPNGDHTDAFALLQRAQPVIEARGSLSQKALVTLQRGYFHIMLREDQRAREFLERGITLHRIVGNRRGVFQGIHWLAYAARWRGDLDTFVTLEEEALTLARDMNDAFAEALVLLNIALGFQDRGEFAGAERYVLEGLALARQRGMSMSEVFFLAEHARIHGRQGNHSAARNLWRVALRQADAMGAVPHLLLCARWLVRLALRDAVAQPTGELQQAAAHLWGVILRLEELLQSAQQYDFDGPIDDLLASVEAALGPEAFAQERDRSLHYTREEALLVLQLYPAEEGR